MENPENGDLVDQVQSYKYNGRTLPLDICEHKEIGRLMRHYASNFALVIAVR